jgi:flotillin
MLPVVFTIGPKDEPLALEIYARLLTDQQNLQDMVMGILEGETRAVAASMAIEEIFSKRKLFKEMIVSNIGAELAVFGMFIYNANVKDLHDMPGSEYFKVDFIGNLVSKTKGNSGYKCYLIKEPSIKQKLMLQMRE